LVRAQGAAGLRRAQLRRLVDRVRERGRRPGGEQSRDGLDGEMIRSGAAAAVAAVLVGAALRRDRGTTSGRAAAFLTGCRAAFGFLLQRSQLCFAAAFRDLFLLRGRRAALGVLAALAVGSVGYAVLFGAQLPDPSRYRPETAHIAPASPVVLLGGLSFGVGMV